MTPEERKEIRGILMKRQKELQGRIQTMKADIRSSGEDRRPPVGRESGYVDIAPVDIDTNAQLMERARVELQLIGTALQQMEEGTYGICSFPLCGGEISVKRLRAIPTAARCITCQAKVEGPANYRRPTASVKIHITEPIDDD